MASTRRNDTNASDRQLNLLPPEGAAQTSQLLSELEDICFQIIDAPAPRNPDDQDRIFWHRKLKNIATPVSLALRECRGPRRFHYHYRHDPLDADHLIPTMGPSPLATLTRVCQRALVACQDIHVLPDRSLQIAHSKLLHSLQHFIALQPAEESA